MKEHTIKQLVVVKSIKRITHDVLQIVTSKPKQYDFVPGQATMVAINRNGWKKKEIPLTFTCLPTDDKLEFIIKTYPSRKGVTNEMLKVERGDELIVHDVFGAIAYKGEGVFIAGGAGITPFISIFRELQSKSEVGANKLIFANKTKADIILEDELVHILGYNLNSILSDEKVDGYAHGLISEKFLKAHLNGSCRNVYLCGPPPMMDAVANHLSELGVDKGAITSEQV